MSAILTNQINRSYIDKLKAKGINWLQINITDEENSLLSTPDDQQPRQLLYINALKKALKELSTCEK